MTILFLLIASKKKLGFRSKLGVFLEFEISIVEIKNQVISNFQPNNPFSTIFHRSVNQESSKNAGLAAIAMILVNIEASVR